MTAQGNIDPRDLAALLRLQEAGEKRSQERDRLIDQFQTEDVDYSPLFQALGLQTDDEIQAGRREWVRRVLDERRVELARARENKAAGGARKRQNANRRDKADVESLRAAQTLLAGEYGPKVYEVAAGCTMDGAAIANLLASVVDREQRELEQRDEEIQRVANPEKAFLVGLFLDAYYKFAFPLTATVSSVAARSEQPPTGPAFEFVRAAATIAGVPVTPSILEEWLKEARGAIRRMGRDPKDPSGLPELPF